MSASSIQKSEQIRRTREDEEIESIHANLTVTIQEYLMKAIGMVQGWKSACNRWQERLQDDPLAAPLLQEISENDAALTRLMDICTRKAADLTSFQAGLRNGWGDLADRCWQQRQEFIRDKHRELNRLGLAWKEEVDQAFENAGFDMSETNKSGGHSDA